ncbi:unnamed protein product [Adineta ricciae]|uniref:F-box domain-containing protein n=1 Tax=Adineta ricciae TaxID=249248 RepID=A0A816D6K5_ADIRI|nr:unnamed protein product [Adineta ricciae]CAF1632332.1 unnamed protein product [Adineta ricciae]
MISNRLTLSIDALPVEILHIIFDNLDAQTIFFSIRSLSRFFRSVVHSYNRYALNLSFISKSNYQQLCRCIPPESIYSLTLSNDHRRLNQINVLISLLNLSQASRLHSLKLLDISEQQLNWILQSIDLKILVYLSCRLRKSSKHCAEVTNVPPTLTVLQTSLTHLEFKASLTAMQSDGVLSTGDTAALIMFEDRMRIDALCQLVQCSPYLCSLNITDVPFGTVNHARFRSFSQLKSLTFTDLSVDINDLESFLALTPALVYLKLIGGRRMLNGKRWEEFIQVNLPHLENFRFYFREARSRESTSQDLENTLNLFKSPFWTEYKKWFVACQNLCRYQAFISICVYSIPICISHVDDCKSTLAIEPLITSSRDMLTMHSIRSMALTIDRTTVCNLQKQSLLIDRPLFRNVTDIELEFSNDESNVSLNSLSEFIDLSRLVHVKISNSYSHKITNHLLADIKHFLRALPNLTSLLIHSDFYLNKPFLTIEEVLAIIPSHVQYLQIPIDQIDQIDMVWQTCQNLSIIELQVNKYTLLSAIIKWFDKNSVNTICRYDRMAVVVWLGKRISPSSESDHRRKRIKLLSSSEKI